MILYTLYSALSFKNVNDDTLQAFVQKDYLVHRTQSNGTIINTNKKAVLSQGNHAMQQLFAAV